MSEYRSLFCGLSGALRADYSPLARFLVNRDSAFLSLIAAASDTKDPVGTVTTCCNPLSQPSQLWQSGLHAQYAAAVTVCGLAIKLEDDAADERGLRKWAAGLFGKSLSGMRDRAIEVLNATRFPTYDVQEAIRSQSAVEARKPDLLGAAEPTSQAYGMIFGHTARLDGASADIDQATALGKSFGRLVYFEDAYADRLQDEKKHRYNPLIGGDISELKQEFTQSAISFCEAVSQTTKGKLAHVADDILSNTWFRHQALLTDEGQHAVTQKSKQNKGKAEKKRSRCRDGCDCCPDTCCSCGNPGKGGCCDSLFDCGPGDAGCIDCCPCDGCSC